MLRQLIESGRKHRARSLAVVALLALAAVALPAAAQLGAQPNQFTLRGNHVRVDYATTSFIGQPTFRYRSGRTDLSFSGDQIQVSESDLGTLVTVVLKVQPDRQTLNFTLVIPQFNLGRQRSAQLHTVGISTTVFTSIGGPGLVQGALASYDSVSLSGTAQLLDF